AAADLTRPFIVVGLGDCDGNARRCRRASRPRLIIAEALLGLELGLLLGLVFMPAALFLGFLASFAGFALGLFDRLAAGAARGLLFGDFSLFDIAQARIGKRARPRTALFFCQGAEQNATGATGCSCSCRRRSRG